MSTRPDDRRWADVSRVLLAGDTHANPRWIGHLCRVASEQNCALIVQVGDFGYFPLDRGGQAFLDATERAGVEHGVHVAFIDGNHDDHTQLAQLRGESYEPVDVSAHITYLPRGVRLRIGGRQFGFLGGAFSVDWRFRTPGRNWWPEEAIDVTDVGRLGLAPLDVLVPTSWRLPLVDEARGLAQRELVRRALDATSPTLAVHGHWHHRHTTRVGTTQVVGLSCDGLDDSWAVLDLTDLSVTG
jgi:predicted phosphodiesterase